jgi:hypothetical protein
MPYKRPSQVPEEEYLVRQFEEAIKGLVQRFRNHPYAFYTESDMHCYLYHRLYAGGKFNGLYKTSEGYDTILLHKEFPTVARYSRQEDNTLKNDPLARRRGAFDICIWDPLDMSAAEHRKQKILCAAELALNECGSCSLHTINDTIKLADPENRIKYGYLLFFVRDSTEYLANEKKIMQQLSDASSKVSVVIARVDKNVKSKPEYLGKWMT